MSGSNMPRSEPLAADRHPAQWLALGVGLLFTIVGIAGFAVTGIDGFAEPDGQLLLGTFEVNPLHNVVHLLIGLAGLGLGRRLRTARIYGWLLAIGYGATFVLGLVVAGSSDPENFLALNHADNWLHAGSAALGLLIALWPAHRRAVGDGHATSRDSPPTTRARRRTGRRGMDRRSRG